MLRNLVLTILFVAAALFGRAQQTNEKFIQETDYLSYLPEGYGADTARQWPLILFLHGSGESGHDLEKVKVHGPPKLVAAGKQFPFILISPQAPDAGTGWEPTTLYRLLQEVKKKYRVDPDRVYLTGLSMGGFGSWALALKHPEEFAAVVPICGGGDTAEIWKLRNMPVWCFHGALDNVVPPERSKQMVAALKKYNPSVRLTIYPDANHNSWEVTYNNDSLYTWLLAQKRFHYQRVAGDPSLLKTYVGKYADEIRDTVELYMAHDSLMAQVRQHGGPFEFQPAAGGVYFMSANRPESLEFVEGKRKGFVFYGDDRILFFRRLK